ncbi:MAG: patatin-like phospholipase family protein, partial [Acidimicrobiales bacterium]
MTSPSPRVGLVLGAGGVAGVAFHAGVLAALDEELGFDARSAEIIVGTSAGSVTAAGLRAGLSPADVFAQTCGDPLSSEGTIIMARAEGGRPRQVVEHPLHWPTGAPAAPSVLLAAGRRPLRVRPAALLAGLIPAGTVPTDPIAEAVDALHPGGWPQKPTWICALRLHSGRLTVFGREGSPRATIGQATAASCAIPGYFAPVVVDGVRYVDGGAHSGPAAHGTGPRRGECPDVSLGPAIRRVGSPRTRVGPNRPRTRGAGPARRRHRRRDHRAGSGGPSGDGAKSNGPEPPGAHRPSGTPVDARTAAPTRSAKATGC